MKKHSLETKSYRIFAVMAVISILGLGCPHKFTVKGRTWWGVPHQVRCTLTQSGFINQRLAPTDWVGHFYTTYDLYASYMNGFDTEGTSTFRARDLRWWWCDKTMGLSPPYVGKTFNIGQICRRFKEASPPDDSNFWESSSASSVWGITADPFGQVIEDGYVCQYGATVPFCTQSDSFGFNLAIVPDTTIHLTASALGYVTTVTTYKKDLWTTTYGKFIMLTSISMWDSASFYLEQWGYVQDTTLGIIAGQVIDSTGNWVAGATISLPNGNYGDILYFHPHTYQLSSATVVDTSHSFNAPNANFLIMNVTPCSSCVLMVKDSLGRSIATFDDLLVLPSYADDPGRASITHVEALIGSPPLAVELSFFTAIGHNGYVEVEWATASEIDNAGFNLYRGLSKDTPNTQLNEALIPGQGDELQGASYSYTDEDVTLGLTYYYWLEDVDLHGKSTMHGPVSAAPTSVEDREEGPIPIIYSLAQNYPNPFNATTAISYQLPAVSSQRSAVSLKIYNLLGQEVRTLVDGEQVPGYYLVAWDGRNSLGKEVASGIYFYRLQAGSYTEIKKMILLK